ncbi:hypothetical protein GCM10023229_20860 [Flavisolibacter ginsenosidimutans]
MTDTPDHIKKLQLEIWLSKPPGERLRQFLVDNDAMYSFWRTAKENMEKKSPLPQSDPS